MTAKTYSKTMAESVQENEMQEKKSICIILEDKQLCLLAFLEREEGKC